VEEDMVKLYLFTYSYFIYITKYIKCVIFIIKEVYW